MSIYISKINKNNTISRILVMGDFNNGTMSDTKIKFKDFSKDLTLKGLNKDLNINSC